MLIGLTTSTDYIGTVRKVRAEIADLDLELITLETMLRRDYPECTLSENK